MVAFYMYIYLFNNVTVTVLIINTQVIKILVHSESKYDHYSVMYNHSSTEQT